jgi:hypothetical protein
LRFKWRLLTGYSTVLILCRTAVALRWVTIALRYM